MNGLITVENAALQNITFSNDLLNHFADYCQVKEITLSGYMVCLRHFAKWLQDHGIRQPQREDIKAYKAYLDKQNFTAGTRAQYLRAVKQFYKWLSVEFGIQNIAENIKGAKVRRDNTKKEAFSETEIKSILESIDRSTEAGKRDFAMVLLSVTCGLRIIELQRADIQDIATISGEKVLYIQRKGRDEKDKYKKIAPEVWEALEDYLKSRHKPRKNDPLFTGTSNRAKGQRFTEPSISRIMKGIFRNAGFDSAKLTSHSLRHSAITIAAKTGKGLIDLQMFADHADPATTQIYIHKADREKDHTEQEIYNHIFYPGRKDTAQQATEALQGLTEAQKQAALDFILSMGENGAQSRKGA